MSNAIQDIEQDIEALQQEQAALQREYKQTEAALVAGDSDDVAALPRLQAALQVITKRLGLREQDKQQAALDAMYAEYQDLRQQADEQQDAIAVHRREIEALQAKIDAELEAIDALEEQHQVTHGKSMNLRRELIKHPYARDIMHKNGDF